MFNRKLEFPNELQFLSLFLIIRIHTFTLLKSITRGTLITSIFTSKKNSNFQNLYQNTILFYLYPFTHICYQNVEEYYISTFINILLIKLK